MATSLTIIGFIWAIFSITAAVLCCCGFYLPYWIQIKDALAFAFLYLANEVGFTISYRLLGFLKLNLNISDSFDINSLLSWKNYRPWAPLREQDPLFYHHEPLYLLLSDEKRFKKGRLLGKVDAYFSSFRRCNYPYVNSLGTVEIVEECGRYTSFWDIPSHWWQASTILVGAGSALSLLIAITAIAACCMTYVVHYNTAKFAGSTQLFSGLLILMGVAIYPMGWDNREMRESCGNSSHIYKLGSCHISWSMYFLISAILLLVLCFGLSFWTSRVGAGSFRI